MKGEAHAPGLDAAAFFARSWRGQGAVKSVFGGTLRSFCADFRSSGSQADGSHVLEETVRYDHGPTLRRSWHITEDGSGRVVGLEALQGGRMVVRPRRGGGFYIRYDRMRFIPGPNVASLSLVCEAQPDGTVRARGWTSLFGVLPMLRTELTFTPA